MFELNFDKSEQAPITTTTLTVIPQTQPSPPPPLTHSHVTFESTKHHNNTLIHTSNSNQITHSASVSIVGGRVSVAPFVITNGTIGSTVLSSPPDMISYVSPKVEDMDISSDDQTITSKIEIRPGAPPLPTPPPPSYHPHSMMANGGVAQHPTKSVISFPPAYTQSRVDNQPPAPTKSITSPSLNQQQHLQHLQQILQHSHPTLLTNQTTTKAPSPNVSSTASHHQQQLPLKQQSLQQPLQPLQQFAIQHLPAATQINNTFPTTESPDDVSITRVKELLKRQPRVGELKQEPSLSVISPLTAPNIAIPEATEEVKAEEIVSPGNCFDMFKKLGNETASTKPLSNDTVTKLIEQVTVTHTPSLTTATPIVNELIPPNVEPVKSQNERLVVRIPLRFVKLKGGVGISASLPIGINNAEDDQDVDILGDDSPLKRKTPHGGHSNSSVVTTGSRKVARIVSSSSSDDDDAADDDDDADSLKEEGVTLNKSLVVRIDLSKLSRLPAGKVSACIYYTCVIYSVIYLCPAFFLDTV